MKIIPRLLFIYWSVMMILTVIVESLVLLDSNANFNNQLLAVTISAIMIGSWIYLLIGFLNSEALQKQESVK